MATDKMDNLTARPGGRARGRGLDPGPARGHGALGPEPLLKRVGRCSGSADQPLGNSGLAAGTEKRVSRWIRSG